MFAFSTLLSFAFSAPVIVSGLVLKRSGCSVQGLKVPTLPTPLVAPSTAPSWVALAVGVQNYTCSSAGTYTNVGAVAELIDISCDVGSTGFSTITDTAIRDWEQFPPSLTIQQFISSLHGDTTPPIIGQHYYVANPITGTGINPKWDFTSEGANAGKKTAFAVCAKVNGAPAPTGSKDIDWVQLGVLTGAPALTGELAKQVYRTDTRLGQPPTSCTPGSRDITVKYAAKYYGFGGSV
ncbi:hypothetical protein GALMADRAFT_106427 [Galerina marginata CBS 339.88]|uniref:Malate dehydrogenase n=1 Tax=Galerina marginata (strain CBS 339.88) TaxID=685588 RepID=A0A067SFJ2_GALM3|nr:hypothetical protein GALMADRAFT_106427 [Galerina marginata CBS 339.88]